MRLTQLIFLGLIVFNFGSPLFCTDDPWSAPALTQDPKVLLKASESFPPNLKVGATILWNRMNCRFEQDGRMHSTAHVIYRIDSNEAIRGLSAVRVVWRPWHQQKPTIRARVIASNGESHGLDASSLVDSP